MIIKAGPNHNVQVSRNIRQVLLSVKESEPGSVPLFGACYGDGDDMGQILKKELVGIQILVGRQFWKFVSSDPDCYDKIVAIASETGGSYRDPEIGTLEEAARRKSAESELKKIYGDRDEFWKNLLGDIA